MPKADPAATCPLCHGPAESGCVLTRDGDAPRWFAGPPTILKNLTSGLWLTGAGEALGGYFPFVGPYLTGLRCRTCKKLVLDERA